MRVDLTGRNVDISPALRQTLSRKLARVERVMQDAIVSAQIVLSRERYRHITDVTLHARGDNVLSGVGTAATWPESMAAAFEKITQQVQRVKEKWTTRKRRAAGGKRVIEVPAPVEEAAVTEEAAQPATVRVRYAIRTHPLDGAIARLDRSPEPFVLFRQGDTGRLTLIYRRRDGGVGLIEPSV
jgi:putative sigma-54 modulation protein